MIVLNENFSAAGWEFCLGLVVFFCLGLIVFASDDL